MCTFRLIILSLGLFFSSLAFSEESMIFAGGGEKDDPFDKISKEILIEAYRRIGINISFNIVPPKRALKLSNSGRLDGEMHRVIGIESDYTDLIRIPIPINKIEVLAYTTQQGISIDTPKDLMDYRVGFRNGIQFAEKISKDVTFYKADSITQLFRMLVLLRVDVAISTRAAGLKAIRMLKEDHVKISNRPLFSMYLYHYLHKKHKATVPLITESLKQMEQERWISQKYEQTMSGLQGNADF